MNSRLFRLLRLLYPRSWRERYADELADLCAEFTTAAEIARWRLVLNIVVAASGERLRSWRYSNHRLAIGSGATVIVVLGLAVATNGFGSFSSTLPSKGPVPINANVNGHVDLNRIPDFVSVVSDGHVVGYAPKVDLFPVRSTEPRLGPVLPPEIVPVYGSDLNTLVGHVYPGEGFTPIGSRPSAEPCVPITAVGSQESELIPCGTVAVAMPDVVGMYTPTGVAELSRLGLNIQIVNVESGQVTPGHIVSTSPAAGARVASRSVIRVDISVRT